MRSMAETFSDEEIRQRANSYDGVPPDVFDRWLEQHDEQVIQRYGTKISYMVAELEHTKSEIRERMDLGYSVEWAEGYDAAIHDVVKLLMGEYGAA